MTPRALVAYCAGLYDGEGSVSVYKGCVRLSVGMTDREPLAAMLRAFGGKIYGPDRSRMYSWRLTGWRNVERAYKAMRTWLCPRRRVQFAKAFAQPRAKAREPVQRPPLCGFDRNRVSNAGHVAHYKRGEKACLDCYHAAQLYMRARKRR